MKKLFYSLSIVLLAGCASFKDRPARIELVTLDPGHFHAAVVQKKSYPDVSDKVYVYAPEGEDLKMHLERIDGYNQRDELPTSWCTEIYAGDDFLEKWFGRRRETC